MPELEFRLMGESRKLMWLSEREFSLLGKGRQRL